MPKNLLYLLLLASVFRSSSGAAEFPPHTPFRRALASGISVKNPAAIKIRIPYQFLEPRILFLLALELEVVFGV